ncbi:unnamed protein product [Notodromas monacha]|uniref:Arrestin-like N-terminal domain-containing protein n=1 Tax=Notodromas monacha TaxID=399045 RepID=A0A7R9GBJ5_9CRUS|nr:unnamed protein product [Notodromas monacha]CAG0915128.1 unnamed protein product [Notodromas monacha]
MMAAGNIEEVEDGTKSKPDLRMTEIKQRFRIRSKQHSDFQSSHSSEIADMSFFESDCRRVYKKSTPNGKLSLYLNNREFPLKAGRTTVVDGLAVINPAAVKDRLVYAQVHLNFRYGREDEEVMGLTFSTEAVLSSEVIYPPEQATIKNHMSRFPLTTFQDVLMKKIGEEAIPFFFEISELSPPSVHLNPAKQYEGSPIGISYDV